MFGIVTLATSDGYAKGALVMARSIRDVGTVGDIVCMVTTGVSEGAQKDLLSVFDDVILVGGLDSHNSAKLKLYSRPELCVTLTKLHYWVKFYFVFIF